MIKIFCGDDTFESYIKAKKEASELSKKIATPIKVVDVDEIEKVDEFLSYFESIGMFAESNIIFAKRLFDNKLLAEYLREHFDRLNQYEIIIWQPSKLDGRKESTKFFKKSKIVFEFLESKEWQIKDWVKKYAELKNLKLSSSQIDFLVQNVGIDKWLLFNELTKLAIVAIDGRVEERVFESTLGFDVKGNLWKFLDYFSSRKLKDALSEFEKIYSYENNAQLIIAMLAREISILLQIKYCKEKNLSTTSLGLHPFVLKKSMEKVNNFTYSELKSLYRTLLKTDLSIKTGELDEENAVVKFLVNITH